MSRMLRLKHDPRSFADALDGTEEQIQTAVVAWCRAQAHTMPGLENIWHMPNYRHIPGNEAARVRAIAKLRALGFADGYPDLGLDMARGPWHGLRLELKTPRGRLTKAQRAWLARLEDLGYSAHAAYGYQDAINIITRYWRGEI